MKLIAQLLLPLFIAAAAQAASISGEIKLNYADPFAGDSSFKKEFGDVVKATTSWHVGDFFGQETVFGGVSLKNPSSKTMYVDYYVAFFDKNGRLIGTASQGTFGNAGLEAGREIQLGSCLIHLPKDKYKEITSYQAIIYETDVPPEKKK